MNTKLNATALAASLVVACSLSAPTFAQSPSAAAPPSEVVRYFDLDLSSPADVRTLYGRIQNAAWHVCGQIITAHNGPSGIENAKCRRTLLDVAVAQMNKPALTALHAGKTPENRTASR